MHAELVRRVHFYLMQCSTMLRAQSFQNFLSTWSLMSILSMSQCLERIRRMRRLMRARIATGSREWAHVLEKHGIDVRSWHCERWHGGLYFPSLGTVVPGPGESVLVSGFHIAVKLHA